MGGGGGRRGGGPTALADGPPPARPPGLRAGSRRRLASTRGGDAMPVASSGAALRARRVGPGPGEVSAGAGRRRPEMSGLPGKAAPAGPGVGGVGGCGRRPVRPVAGMVAVGWRVAGPGWLSAGRGVGCRTVQTGGPTKKRRVVVVKKKKQQPVSQPRGRSHPFPIRAPLVSVGGSRACRRDPLTRTQSSVQRVQTQQRTRPISHQKKPSLSWFYSLSPYSTSLPQSGHALRTASASAAQAAWYRCPQGRRARRSPAS